MVKAYKVRIYPNKEQEQILLQTIGACRWVWNYYLDLQINAYAQTGLSIPYNEMSRDLSQLRNNGGYPWLKEVRYRPLQDSIRTLGTAYDRFFRKLSGHPRFKSKKNAKQSFYKPREWSLSDGRLRIQSDIVVRCRGRLPGADGELRGLTVSRTNTGKWFASMTVIEPDPEPRKLEGAVGIDLGLADLAITSAGERFENLHLHKSQLRRLKRLQQAVARKERGSNRHIKAKLEVARLHEKIANQRTNHLHQVSTAITGKNHALIAVEDLAVANMLKNRHLSRAISDVSWGELLRQIEYKQKWRGGSFVKVGRFFPSSKTCSNCGSVRKSLPLNIRKWTCADCGTTHDRDINAAINILKQAGTQLGVESTESKAFSPMVTGSLKRGHVYRDVDPIGRSLNSELNKEAPRPQERTT